MEFVGTVTQLSVLSKQPESIFGRRLFTSLESQGLAGDQNDISALVPTIHLILSLTTLVLPGSTRRIVQTGSLIGLATDIAGADNTMAVGDSEVEQAPSIHSLILDHALRDFSNEVVDLLDRLEHSLAQNTWSKTSRRWGTWIVAHTFQSIEIQGECPLAVRATLYA